MFKKIYQFLFLLSPLCLLFFLGLFLDTKKTKSELESRNLSEIPTNPFIQRKNFETYVSEHIPFREKLLTIYFSLNLKLSSMQTQNIVGKDNWVFAIKNPVKDNLPVLKSYQNYQLLTPNDTKKIIKNLKNIKKYCDENNIKLYLMFPPDKSRIYSRFMPDFILRKNNDSSVTQLKKQIPDEINIISLEKELIDFSLISKDLLFYKEESHWSEEGAFFAYQQLIKKIKQDFPSLKPLSKNEFFIVKKQPYQPYYIGAQHRFGQGNQYMPKLGQEQNLYNHYTYKNKNDIQVHWDKNFRHSTYNKGVPLNIYIIGDSYATYLHPFLSATFKRVRAFRFNMPKEKWGIQFNARKKEFKTEKPDILILSVSDLKLKDLLEVD